MATATLPADPDALIDELRDYEDPRVQQLALLAYEQRFELNQIRETLDAETRAQDQIRRAFDRLNPIIETLAGDSDNTLESTGPNPANLKFVSAMAALEPDTDAFYQQLAEIDALLDGEGHDDDDWRDREVDPNAFHGADGSY